MNLERRIVDEIVGICHKYEHIRKVILFGSRAREDNSIKSDIDLAIYCDNSIVDFIEDIEMNTSSNLSHSVFGSTPGGNRIFQVQVQNKYVTDKTNDTSQYRLLFLNKDISINVNIVSYYNLKTRSDSMKGISKLETSSNKGVRPLCKITRYKFKII